ncbi:MAG: beta-lactamase family protein [Symploca sp. SIO1C4]|uniref:Beta-lactamase family protein n=1 Tax=Symploca sp. SIO1C4 TaxID=2607765 RepID=A0A6B3NCE3_9CYAN|nr:beta-lactamase family protein [Symploca sp. SIO1C4]
MKNAIAVLVGLALIWLVSGVPCWATGLSTEPIEITPQQELEAFLDRFFARQMSNKHIPGVAFVLVKDGKISFSKGYGYADLEKKIPVIPEQTLFRVGSISKLFTATAIMQLAEKGLLNLDDDVNEYLDNFQIDKTFPQPITFANLLTHTDGFDSGWGLGAFAHSQAQMTVLADYLAQRLPPRLLPPGEVFLYSDVGMTLAGYLVEVISGIPFSQYIDQNIFQPLGMRHSSFLQPLPLKLAPNLAVGYKYGQTKAEGRGQRAEGIDFDMASQDGIYQRRSFAFNNSVPAAALMSTATDMGQFMIAHLQNGRYSKTRILEEATAKKMHRRQFTHHPNLAGSAYGFYERFLNQQRSIEHSGRMNGYSSLLFLLPEQNLGFFVACNNNAGSLFRELVSQFMDHYYPVSRKLTPLSNSATLTQEHLQKFQGTYRYNRYSHSTIEKLGAVLGEAPEIRVIAGNDGTLAVSSLGKKWVEEEPLLFRSQFADIYMAFRQNQRGEITYMFLGNSIFATLERLAWYETTAFHFKLVVFCALVFLSSCLGGLISWFRSNLFKLPTKAEGRRQKAEVFFILNSRKSSFKQASGITKLAQFLAVLVSSLNLVFMIGMGLVVFRTDFWEFFYGLPKVAIALLYIPLLSVSLTVGLLILVVLVWKNQSWSWLGRLYYCLITLAALVFIPLLDYWNLLGFRF